MMLCYNVVSYYGEMLQYGAILWCDIRYHVLLRDILWCHILRCDIIRCHILWCDIIRCHILWCDIILCHSVNPVGWLDFIQEITTAVCSLTLFFPELRTARHYST
jgi:hypothetical protein